MAARALSRLRMEFASVEALRNQVSADLRKGRAFVEGAGGVRERELCELILVHPTTGRELVLVADAVWVKTDEPGAGVGVQLHEFDAEALARLDDFVEDAVHEASLGSEGDAAAATGPEARTRARNIHERVRRLSTRERDVMARQGTLAERVALERCYGGAVWEGLLHNPTLTPPEVARIAKNGNLPRPLVGLIVSNGSWVGIPEIQRALLTNPRVSGQHLERVLRAMAPADLARVAKQTNYRMQVRQAARRLINR